MDFFVSISSLENWMPWEEANESSWKTFCRQGRLPSKNELKIIYENKSVISSLSIAAGGSRLGDGHYWSSDYEVPDYYGPRYYYFVDMVNGDSYWEDANTLNVVRPVFKP